MFTHCVLQKLPNSAFLLIRKCICMTLKTKCSSIFIYYNVTLILSCNILQKNTLEFEPQQNKCRVLEIGFLL